METSEPEPLKFTIATVTYNASALIRRTISSIEEQDYPHVEHLIIDGNSTDDTLQQIHHYQERNSTASVQHEVNCLSEPDEGIYDAMNKALAEATGSYIVFLNAGDTLASPRTLSRLAEVIAGQDALPAVVYGDTDVTDPEGHYLRHRRLTPPEQLTWRSFRSGMLVCHQAFYARTDIARTCPYDMRYRFSSDFDWCIRIMKEAGRQGLPLVNARSVVANFADGGATTKHHSRSLRERFRIMCRHYGLLSTSFMHAWFLLRSVIKR